MTSAANGISLDLSIVIKAETSLMESNVLLGLIRAAGGSFE